MKMTEADNLVLEHLKRLQKSINDVRPDIANIATDIRGIKGHMAASMQNEVSQDSSLAEFRIRLERIEQRLELRDAP